MSPFNNMDLVWTNVFQDGKAQIIKVECTNIPHVWISKFLNGERSHEDSPMEWNIYKLLTPQVDIKMPIIQNHLG
jgi:hypothetical protein